MNRGPLRDKCASSEWLCVLTNNKMDIGSFFCSKFKRHAA